MQIATENNISQGMPTMFYSDFVIEWHWIKQRFTKALRWLRLWSTILSKDIGWRGKAADLLSKDSWLDEVCSGAWSVIVSPIDLGYKWSFSVVTWLVPSFLVSSLISKKLECWGSEQRRALSYFRYGRRPVMGVSFILMTISVFLCAFGPQTRYGFWKSYTIFVVARFLIACATRGISVSGFVLGSEIGKSLGALISRSKNFLLQLERRNASWRALLSSISSQLANFSWSFSHISSELGVLWPGPSVYSPFRSFYSICSISSTANWSQSFISNFPFSILPESPRWLISKGQFDRAEVILRRIATANKKRFDPEAYEKVKEEQRKVVKQIPIWTAFLLLFFWQLDHVQQVWTRRFHELVSLQNHVSDQFKYVSPVVRESYQDEHELDFSLGWFKIWYFTVFHKIQVTFILPTPCRMSMNTTSFQDLGNWIPTCRLRSVVLLNY